MALKVSATRAAELHQQRTAALIAARRSILVLDLDNTLVHATTEQELQAASTRIGAPLSFQPSAKVYTVRAAGTTFVLRDRPGLVDFLQAASKLFELHMYTNGTRSYAAAVAACIDPDSHFFQNRILTRDECVGLDKDLKRLLPLGDELAIVLDDRSDVWDDADNLIQVSPFRFFTVARSLNALPDDEEPDGKVLDNTEQRLFLVKDRERKAAADDELKVVGGLLESLHAEWFAELERRGSDALVPDYKSLLRRRRRRVFSGCTFVFSSLFPRGDDRRRAEVVRLTARYGGSWVEELPAEGSYTRVTHVVSARPGTDKVMQALARSSVYIVSASWFYESIRRLARQPEANHALTPTTPVLNGPAPEIVVNEWESDDDDDGDDDDDDDDDGDDDDESGEDGGDDEKDGDEVDTRKRSVDGGEADVVSSDAKRRRRGDDEVPTVMPSDTDLLATLEAAMR